MNHQLTFQSEFLRIDWISFKFKALEKSTESKLVDRLSKFRFNCFQQSGKLVNPKKEILSVSPENEFEVIFVKNSTYRNGTIVQFSGPNAERFYRILKHGWIDYKLFSSSEISRLDLCYCRKHKAPDEFDVAHFFQTCFDKLNQLIKTVALEKNLDGWILKIDNRRRNNYSRIYEGLGFLKFEHEMKGKPLQSYNQLLVQKNFKQFEEQLFFHFTKHFGSLLPLNSPYTDWLLINVRTINSSKFIENGLNSDYIKSEIDADIPSFIYLIQFLTYVQDLSYEMRYMHTIPFRFFRVNLEDFLQFQDPTADTLSWDKKRKIKEFFDKLQKGYYVTSFDRTSFHSVVIAPSIEVKKCASSGGYQAEVWLLDKLFAHKYLLKIPNFFSQKLTKVEQRIRFKLF